LITVRHEVAKQTPRKMGNRRFIPMEAALLHWLRPYRKREGLLVPLVDSAVRRRMKKLCFHSKVNPPNNALPAMARLTWPQAAAWCRSGRRVSARLGTFEIAEPYRANQAYASGLRGVAREQDQKQAAFSSSLFTAKPNRETERFVH